MAKKHKKRESAVSSSQMKPPARQTLSPLGKKVIAGGIGLLIVGFWALTRTDPYGRNWASTLAPFLILGAYGIIAAGIFLPKKTEADLPQASPSSPASFK